MATATKRPTRPLRDPTIYPVEDDTPESVFQKLVVELLRPLLQRWLSERGVVAFVGGNQFIYYRQYDPKRACVAPDLYVLPGVAPGTDVTCWKTWETGVVPSFALEVVSRDVPKDYIHTPQRYDELGVRELVIFDREYAAASDRARWQVYRRLRSRGLVSVEVSNEDRVRSRALGAWLRTTGEGADERVRLATGTHGETVVPSDAERAESEARRAESEARRAESEARRAESEARRADVAEQRAAELLAELERLRRGQK